MGTRKLKEGKKRRERKDTDRKNNQGNTVKEGNGRKS